MKRLLVAALAFALNAPALAATQGSSAPPQWLDPFCAVHATVVAWNPSTNAPTDGGASQTYRLQLISQKSGSTLDAHVSLADDTGIYNARVRSAPLTGKPYELQTPVYLVTLPKPATIAYAWVASYFVDDTPQVACPTEVSAVHQTASGAALPAPEAGRAVTATLSRAVGSLACGSLYTPPAIAKGPKKSDVQVEEQPEQWSTNDSTMWQPLETSDEVVGIHRKDTADVVVFLDLEGNAVNTYLSVSTGVPDEDKIALNVAQQLAFKPATFLCSPTVGHYVFQAPFSR